MGKIGNAIPEGVGFVTMVALLLVMVIVVWDELGG
jgi:hypothetical protein